MLILAIAARYFKQLIIMAKTCQAYDIFSASIRAVSALHALAAGQGSDIMSIMSLMEPKAPITASELGTIGGRARMARMTPEQRRALARKAGRLGGLARAKALTSEQRRAIASLGSAAALKARRRKSEQAAS